MRPVLAIVERSTNGVVDDRRTFVSVTFRGARRTGRTCQRTRPPGSAAFVFYHFLDNVPLTRPIHPVAGDFIVMHSKRFGGHGND